MASKKAYIILNKDTGSPLQILQHDKLSKPFIQECCLDFPIMTLSKTKCLILESPNQATYFDDM